MIAGEAVRPVPRRTEFAVLTRALRAAGLLERRRGWYAALIVATTTLLGATVAAFVAIGDSWWTVALAPVFAVVAGQCGFIGHDAGHRQIFDSARANDAVGYVAGNLAIGLGYARWVAEHNAHHANPNHETRDPDVQIPVLAFSAEQATGRRGPLGFVARHQAVLFFPLLLLEGLSMHVGSVRALLDGEVARPRLEATLLAVHALVYLGAVFLVLSPGPAVVFVVVQQGLFGLYLGAVFAPNHKGMPMVSAADRLDPVRKQVLTSRNIRGNVLVDHAMGGLNHQIEHHLFTRMPRPNLRRARPLVAAFCERQGITYTETGLLDSYARTLRHLHEAGAPLRGEQGSGASAGIEGVGER
ncbi:fatty acid desaturase [Actinomycetospora sp. NBRC 106375]|uniref:fatty acid desaturase family protein n=1 Tax=Actinomycetospora sp. NBRC 106375 TaxID=3032207 RepID=UPI0024A605C7|nr:acyl-CoA desaturase [Actinomycetospora sp. NBRC 106375]GLZ48939.1 fatty acid desaturase [Actinomycetospora sp. NBRC 106375]